MDYKVQKKMQKVVNDYSNKGVTVTGNYDVYIDACADRYAFMDIVIGVVPCLMAVWFLYIARKKDRFTDKNLQKPTCINIKGILWIVGTLIYIIVFIHTLSMK